MDIKNNKIYRCNNCFRFMGKDLMGEIYKSGNEGRCKKCNSIRAIIWRAINSKRSEKYRADWYQKNKERALIARALYVKNYPEKIKLSQEKWKKNNPEKLKESNERYYIENKQEIRERSILWSKQNPERKREADNAYTKRNPEKGRINNARRRARKKGAVDSSANRENIAMIYAYAVHLTKITGIKYVVDHIISYSTGGKDHEDNLQILTQLQNNKKGTKLNTGIVGPRLPEIKAYYSKSIAVEA